MDFFSFIFIFVQQLAASNDEVITGWWRIIVKSKQT
jgi:hypothetical protein